MSGGPTPAYTDAQIEALTNPATNRIGIVRLSGTTVTGRCSVHPSALLGHMKACPGDAPVPPAEFAKIDGTANWTWNGTQATSQPFAAPSLASTATSALATIEAQAGKQRAKHSSADPWRLLLALSTESEAHRVLALTDPAKAQAADYPLLALTTAPSLAAAAQAVATAALARSTALAAIEVARLAARATIKAAQTPDAVQAAVQKVVWP